jgi:FkbM family methyltransferase
MTIKGHLRSSKSARALREWVSRIERVSESPFRRVISEIDKTNVSVVIDVGANIGQFGIDIRRYGYRGRIISYEPVKNTFSLLLKTIPKHQPWDAIQLGLGSIETTEVINVSGNSGLSSSLLKMKSVHVDNFPKSATVSSESIQISTIDCQLSNLGVSPEDIMLKLDVQGFEGLVLRGAVNSLSKIPLCFLEVSLRPLYEGEMTLLPILSLLQESGHEVVEVFRGIKGKNGQLMQLDILTKLSNV